MCGLTRTYSIVSYLVSVFSRVQIPDVLKFYSFWHVFIKGLKYGWCVGFYWFWSGGVVFQDHFQGGSHGQKLMKFGTHISADVTPGSRFGPERGPVMLASPWSLGPGI